MKFYFSSDQFGWKLEPLRRDVDKPREVHGSESVKFEVFIALNMNIFVISPKDMGGDFSI